MDNGNGMKGQAHMQYVVSMLWERSQREKSIIEQREVIFNRPFESAGGIFRAHGSEGISSNERKEEKTVHPCAEDRAAYMWEDEVLFSQGSMKQGSN